MRWTENLNLFLLINCCCKYSQWIWEAVDGTLCFVSVYAINSTTSVVSPYLNIFGRFCEITLMNGGIYGLLYLYIYIYKNEIAIINTVEKVQERWSFSNVSHFGCDFYAVSHFMPILFIHNEIVSVLKRKEESV